MKKISFLLLYLLCILYSHAAISQTNDANTTLIDSKDFVYDDLNQTSVFTGSVVLTRGSLLLKADKLEMRQDPRGFQFANASSGGYVYFRQTLENGRDYFEGRARNVSYNGQLETITLNNQAEISKFVCGMKQDSIKGATITFNQRTESYKAVGGAESPTTNQQVRTIFQSESTNTPCNQPPSKR